MPDRADFLARHILTRLSSLETALREDSTEDSEEADPRRLSLVEEFLAVDVGILDHATTLLVAQPLPALPSAYY